ncbi:aldolase [Rathayibacter festucae DSM 15932]|uniref:Aldolase n=1 Tax=Rathayibacter festucae DSM 15932 TaxID=1328866 RepID=A0A3T0T6L6_9MICO|nr:aldolase [Rathayibacter festucae DSM 15932]
MRRRREARRHRVGGDEEGDGHGVPGRGRDAVHHGHAHSRPSSRDRTCVRIRPSVGRPHRHRHRRALARRRPRCARIGPVDAERVLGDGRADGVWCRLGEPLTVAQIARGGPAWLCLDAQHGAFDDAAVLATMRALATVSERPPVAVRVAGLSDPLIGRALDAGADVVVVPMIESVEDAAAAVRAAHYPPLGRRSWGPMTDLWGAAPPSAAEARPALWLMIETQTGLDAVEEILAVPGVAGVFVGPFDLAIGLGRELPDLLAADGPEDPLPRIAAAARNAGLVAGAYAGDQERARQLRALGFPRVAVATDQSLIALGTAAALGAVADGSGC